MANIEWDVANDLNARCSEVGSYSVPDYSSYFNAMEGLASNDGLSGVVPDTKKKLVTFDTAHANDISA